MALITVLISTYNRSNSLEKVLKNLKDLEYNASFDHEIIVVDNNSTDNTRETVQRFSRDFDGRLKYLFEKKQGKSYALNQGIRKARGEIIAFTDDDVIIDSRWLKEIDDFFKHNDCMGVGGKVLPIWPPKVPRWVYVKNRPVTDFGPIVIHDYGEGVIQYTKEVCPPVGCNMAFRKEAFDNYGLFQVKMGKKGEQTCGDDTEFCLRLRNAGEKIFFIPSVLIYHPVEEKRLTKRYFLKWFFYSGRAIAKIEKIPDGSRCIFYIPAYMYKKILKKFGKLIALILFRKREVFECMTTLSYNMGQACQFALMRRGIER